MADATTLTVTLDLYPRLLPKARVQNDRITGERTLLYPEGVLILNPTSSAIVDLCDGTHTVHEVIGILAERYEAVADQIACDVLDYVERLNSLCVIGLAGEASK